jgi:hypothetical protein
MKYFILAAVSLVLAAPFRVAPAFADTIQVGDADSIVYCNPGDTVLIASPNSKTTAYVRVNAQSTEPLSSSSFTWLAGRGSIGSNTISFYHASPSRLGMIPDKSFSVIVLDRPAFSIGNVGAISGDKISPTIVPARNAPFQASSVSYYLDNKFIVYGAGSNFGAQISLEDAAAGRHIFTAYATDSFGSHYQFSTPFTPAYWSTAAQRTGLASRGRLKSRRTPPSFC